MKMLARHENNISQTWERTGRRPLPPERRPPARQVLRFQQKRAGSEIGAPLLPSKSVAVGGCARTRRFRWLGVELRGQIEKHMKRWAALTVLIYALALLVLTFPVIWIAFSGWSDKSITLPFALRIYRHWSYWLWLTVLITGQALLLLLPINISERRLTLRRPLKTPVIVTAFFLANLCFAGLVSILCLYFQEDGFNFFGYFLPFKANQISPSDF